MKNCSSFYSAASTTSKIRKNVSKYSTLLRQIRQNFSQTVTYRMRNCKKLWQMCTCRSWLWINLIFAPLIFVWFFSAVFTLPKLTPAKNYRITFLRIESDNSANFDFAKTAKLFLMAYEAELYLEGTARGHVIVFDCKNIGFRHILKCGVEMWKKIIKLTQVFSSLLSFRLFLREISNQRFHTRQEALPVRNKTLHLLNTNYFVYKCVQFLKPFMKPEVFSTVTPRFNHPHCQVGLECVIR